MFVKKNWITSLKPLVNQIISYKQITAHKVQHTSPINLNNYLKIFVSRIFYTCSQRTGSWYRKMNHIRVGSSGAGAQMSKAKTKNCSAVWISLNQHSGSVTTPSNSHYSTVRGWCWSSSSCFHRTKLRHPNWVIGVFRSWRLIFIFHLQFVSRWGFFLRPDRFWSGLLIAQSDMMLLAVW